MSIRKMFCKVFNPGHATTFFGAINQYNTKHANIYKENMINHRLNIHVAYNILSSCVDNLEINLR